MSCLHVDDALQELGEALQLLGRVVVEDRRRLLASTAHTASRAARSPTSLATTPQSGPAAVALRPASIAQSTGLRFLAVCIQSGSRSPRISAVDRNVSGSTTNVTAPISADAATSTTTPPGKLGRTATAALRGGIKGVDNESVL